VEVLGQGRFGPEKRFKDGANHHECYGEMNAGDAIPNLQDYNRYCKNLKTLGVGS